ncbi:MAG: DUF2726 domain-containing protein [Anaerolineales bacterium]|nr:DUF2726 domain-containing protein [Anaerolineales bacterium]
MGTKPNTKPGCLSFLLTLFNFSQKEEISYPYLLRDSILSKNELAFYHSLSHVVGSKFVILSKVRLSDIFLPQHGKGYYAALNRINPRHVDFLLVDPNTFKPILGIELDDRSHSRPDRQERDDFVNGLYDAMNLPLLHMPAKHGYEVNEIKQGIVTTIRENQSKHNSV